jgi:hypothetical protein
VADKGDGSQNVPIVSAVVESVLSQRVAIEPNKPESEAEDTKKLINRLFLGA